MAVHPLVIKAIAMAATDKRTWKFLAVLIATLLTPVIFLVICIVMIFSSAEVTSGSVIEYRYGVTAEYARG
jgi:cytochrome c oxidase subunit IV